MDSGRLVFDGSSHNMLFIGNNDPVLRGYSTSLTAAPGSMIGFGPAFHRPFYAITDNLMDDEFLDEHTSEKKRKLTPEQVHQLEISFEAENKLEPDRKVELAKKLGLQPRQVAVWFQNRRARWKTKQLERDFDLLKSAYDSLSSDYQSLVKVSEKLKSEVASLQEKLLAKEIRSERASNLPTENKAANLQCKVEDGLSSGGSVVMDDDGAHLIDSGNSNFPYYMGMEMVRSEDERRYSSNEPFCVGNLDGDGSSYFAGTCVVPEKAEEEQLALFAWS